MRRKKNVWVCASNGTNQYRQLWHRRIAEKRFMDSISCLTNVYFSFELLYLIFDSIGTIHQPITQWMRRIHEEKETTTQKNMLLTDVRAEKYVNMKEHKILFQWFNGMVQCFDSGIVIYIAFIDLIGYSMFFVTVEMFKSFFCFLKTIFHLPSEIFLPPFRSLRAYQCRGKHTHTHTHISPIFSSAIKIWQITGNGCMLWTKPTSKQTHDKISTKFTFEWSTWQSLHLILLGLGQRAGIGIIRST